MSPKDLMGIPLRDLLSEIDESIEEPDPGEEYLSTEQWGQTWGVSTHRASRAIRRLTKAGRMAVSLKLERNRCGVTYKKPVYKLLDKGAREDA